MVNKVILVGNCGKNPESRTLENGTTVTTFSLATSETFKDKNGERQTNTTWHNVILWRGLAEVAQKYVQKGQLLAIEGKISNRTYEDKDGNKKYISEVVGSEMKMLGKSESKPDQESQPSNEETDSLPF